jgi:hypothetical protein
MLESSEVGELYMVGSQAVWVRNRELGGMGTCYRVGRYWYMVLGHGREWVRSGYIVELGGMGTIRELGGMGT